MNRTGSLRTAMFLALFGIAVGVVADERDDDAAVTTEVLAFLEKAASGSLADALDVRAIARLAAQRAGIKADLAVGMTERLRAGLNQQVELDLSDFRVRTVKRTAADTCSVVGDSGSGDSWARYRLTVRRTGEGWRIVDCRDVSGALGMLDLVVLGIDAGRRGDMGVQRAVSAMMRVRQSYEELDVDELLAIMKPVADVKLPPKLDAQRHVVVAWLKSGYDSEGTLADADRALACVNGLPYALLLKAHALVELERPAEALPICARHRQAIGDSVEIRLVEVAALKALGREADARTACVAGLQEEVRADILSRYATLLPDERKPEILDYLREFRDLAGAMDELGREFSDVEEWSALEMVCARARRRIPAHPDVAYYDAVAKMALMHLEAAEMVIYPAIAIAPAEERSSFVKLYLDTMVLQEKGPEGYGELEARDREAGFAYLARELWSESRNEKLRKLLARRRTETRDHGLVLAWEAELLYVEKKYAEVVSFVRRHRAAMTGLPEDDEWIPYDRLVRALVKLKKLDEALGEAKRIAAERKDPFYLLMTHAAAGRAKEAIRCFTEAVEKTGYVADDLYADPDIGPRLVGPAYAALRVKYPPPEPEPDE